MSCKFGVITDTHFDYKYESRKDDTLTTLLDKTEQCYRFFEREKCDFVVHIGDLFDRHRIFNYDLLKRVRGVFKNTYLKTIFIWGQHDLYGYARTTTEKSSLAFIRDISDGQLIPVFDKLELDNCVIYASHVDQDVKEVASSIPVYNKPVILMAHCLLTEKEEMFKTVSFDAVAGSNVNVVLSGDLHRGFPFQKREDIYFYNPGALARTDSSARDRKPHVACIEIENFLDGYLPLINEFYPKCPTGDEIFGESSMIEEVAVVNKESAVAGSYIEAFKQFKTEAVDIYDMLEKIGTSKGVDKKILAMINQYKDKVKE